MNKKGAVMKQESIFDLSDEEVEEFLMLIQKDFHNLFITLTKDMKEQNKFLLLVNFYSHGLSWLVNTCVHEEKRDSFMAKIIDNIYKSFSSQSLPLETSKADE
jgi:hypothetical protein